MVFLTLATMEKVVVAVVVVVLVVVCLHSASLIVWSCVMEAWKLGTLVDAFAP